MNAKTKLITALQLGLPNLARVLMYRLSVKVGLNPVMRLPKVDLEGSYFHAIEVSPVTSGSYTPPSYRPFGWCSPVSLEDINWHKNYLTGRCVEHPKSPWYSIPDFAVSVGDIKGVWEASRLDWLLHLATDYVSGHEDALHVINNTLSNWAESNPTYFGPNWKCGQEASIRVMHLAFAAKLLQQVSEPEPGLRVLVKAHLNRIAPTISYAVAQDNNHGTSEAAALFIGGSWLLQLGDRDAEKWLILGRKWLENRAKRLIEPDGSFSQYSVNYHRVMLDTYVMAEIWRRDLRLEPFSTLVYAKLKEATNWLYQLTDEVSGDAPNLGANDGARLLPLSNTDYRDFRPTVQLASALFFECSAWSSEGGYDSPLELLSIKKPLSVLQPQSSFHFEDGGYMGLRTQQDTLVLMNYPKFRFRPSQCDALHLDFWHKGENLLRDGGSYSYNAGNDYINYYGGVISHNTVQFDDHDQMPRLSRFLLGNWLKARSIEWNATNRSCKASYQDQFGCSHTRAVDLSDSSLIVKDDLAGFKKSAILRWRLKPGNWMVSNDIVTDGKHSILIKSEAPIIRIDLVAGRESRYYYHESTVPVLEIEVASEGTIITEYKYI